MSNVLYIKANAKPEGASRTMQIADTFIKEYKQNHPEDSVTTLDLYKEGIKPLTSEDLQSVFGQKSEESKNHPILKYAYQFAETDKFVIAEPMWNLSFPAILKLYIDYICVTGITFKYTEEGPVGLCKGKAINITTRGGAYSKGAGAAMEMGDRYLRPLFGFLGIKDYTTISADELDVVGKDVNTILNNAIQQAIQLAKTF